MPRTSRKPRGSLETPSPPRATAFTHEGRRRAPPPSPRSRSEWRGGRLGALPRAGWGALPRGASLTIRRGCRWLPWPNRRNTLVALSPRPATPHPTPPRHSASPSGGREEREADMCESGSRKGEGRLGQVELWLAGAVAFLATFVASSSSPPFRCARRSRGKRWLKTGFVPRAEPEHPGKPHKVAARPKPSAPVGTAEKPATPTSAKVAARPKPTQETP